MKKSNKEVYSVWVGGSEVNDYYLNKREAINLSNTYKANGYKDVIIKKGKPKFKVGDVIVSKSELLYSIRTIESIADYGYKCDDGVLVGYDYEDNYDLVKSINLNYSIGNIFTGLIPCWINAPSTNQIGHEYHGKNAVAIKEKDGGYRLCLINDVTPKTIHLPETVNLVEGWNKFNTLTKSNIKLIKGILIGKIDLNSVKDRIGFLLAKLDRITYC